MIKFEQALNIVTESVKHIVAEQINFAESLGRVLAEDVVSDMDMPPFDKSAMDGYACRYEDIKNELEVIEIIPAGQVPEKEIKQNQCAKIMTGAMIPKGADCVIMVEYTKELDSRKIKYTKEVENINICQLSFKEKRMLNICYKAEDINSGATVITKGTLIKPHHIAIMASVGSTKVSVSKRPKVAVIPTGNEIVEPHIKPLPSQIRNSNGSQLVAQLKNIGIDVQYYGIARDTESETIRLIEKAYQENDLIILTGGVSKGDYDLVPEILKKLEFNLLFEEVAVQPGKPTVFGQRNDKFCFGLPGNPVSSFVQFEALVKPFLYKMMQRKYQTLDIMFPIGKAYSRKRANRLAFLPVVINERGEVMPVEYHGSAHINGYNPAWGLMQIPVGVTELKKGDKVNVRQI